ncbi:hypothetical protein AXE84_09990 [Actinomyces oris]|nr:hypothetical protein AXE84_09990 [Actinomyces oris]
MPGDVLSVGTPQGAQLGPGAAFKICRLDVVRNRGLGDALTLRWTTTPVITPATRVLPSGAVVDTPRPATMTAAAPITVLTITTPFVTPVVAAPAIIVRRVLPAARPLGTSPRAVGVIVPSRASAAARVSVFPCGTVTRSEAVTLAIVATPTCLAVVRAVLTVLIRHGPSFTPGLPSVPPLSLNTWEEPTWTKVLRRNGTRRHVVWCTLIGAAY